MGAAGAPSSCPRESTVGLGAFLPPPSQRAESDGVSVKLTSSETAIANAIVQPKLFMNWPTIPLMNASGRNTAIRLTVVAVTAGALSRLPPIAAPAGGRDRRLPEIG